MIKLENIGNDEIIREFVKLFLELINVMSCMYFNSLYVYLT